jgi:hypothetical protein
MPGDIRHSLANTREVTIGVLVIMFTTSSGDWFVGLL